MAGQGIGLGKILFLIGAGCTGLIIMKKEKLLEFLKDFQAGVWLPSSGFGGLGNCCGGGFGYVPGSWSLSGPIPPQTFRERPQTFREPEVLRFGHKVPFSELTTILIDYRHGVYYQLSVLARRLQASSRHIIVVDGHSGEIGVDGDSGEIGNMASSNITSLLVPAAAAALGALGYGYMRWKGLSFSDVMDSIANVVTSIARHLKQVSPAFTAFYQALRSSNSKKFMIGCVILVPIANTLYNAWWFIRFKLVDGFFSPIYAKLGINIFGLEFETSIAFIFLSGFVMSKWLRASMLNLREWFIQRISFVCRIDNAINAARSLEHNNQSFKEVAIIRHPGVGEYVLGFITSTVTLQHGSGEEELCCIYVPTNHLHIGHIFLINTNDVIRPNLSVREGIEIFESGGLSMPQILSMLDSEVIQADRTRSTRS